jgi:hypothetical protein
MLWRACTRMASAVSASCRSVSLGASCQSGAFQWSRIYLVWSLNSTLAPLLAYVLGCLLTAASWVQAQRRHEEGAAAAANSVVSSLGGALGSVSSVDSLASQSPSATSSGEPYLYLHTTCS